MKERFLYTAAMVREMDRVAIEELGIPGLALMRRAAEACVSQIIELHPEFRSITVFCGSGNNAGDGYIIAGILADRKYRVQVIEIGDRSKLGADATAAFDYCKSTTVSFDAGEGGILGELVVDALLGTGLSGSVRDTYSEAIKRINDSGKPVVAVDIPSGICADTGSVLGSAVEADLTVTFIGRKRGLYTNEGPDHAGVVIFDSLGVQEGDAEKVDPGAIRVLEPQQLVKRRRNSYKTSHGHVLVIGGDHGMGGAVIMASEAALRVGAGLVSVATRAEHTDALLARRPEVMVKGVQDPSDLASMIDRATTLVVGPGLGQSEWSKALLRAATESKLPLIIDADGLNLLAAEDLKSEFSVLTPHPGEAARLLDDGSSPSTIQEDRFAAIGKIQKKYGGVVLLKGVGTIVTDGEEISLCPYGNPGMATAGMGDVLSGVVGGLLAQGLSAYDAATQGAVIHARAGDLAAYQSGERGLLATDLLPIVRDLINVHH